MREQTKKLLKEDLKEKEFALDKTEAKKEISHLKHIKSNWKLFLHEFDEHLPFAILVSVIAFVLIGLGSFFDVRFGAGMFEPIHFVHLFFSAAATTAVYSKYSSGIFRGLSIGVIGAILVGSISDVLFPHFVAFLFQFPAIFHLPLYEAPLIVLLVSVVGSIFGILLKKSAFSHSIHVFLSVFASLFYLVNYVHLNGLFAWVIAFLILVLTVWLPCCLSDLAIPMLFAKNNKKCGHHC
jgi:hypothetical protein